MKSNSFLYRFLLAAFALLGGVSLHAQYSLSNLWSISTADARNYVTSGATERGIAYSAVSNHVYIVSRASGLQVAILNGDDGTEIGFLDVTGISGGTFALSQIGVAEDGAIYAGNLSTGGGAYQVYRWENESATPALVFTGAPGGGVGQRWGDNFDVRGAGTNTEVLVASGDSTTAAILRPVDETMASFAATTLTVSGLSNGDMQKGVAFGTNNTFFAKRTGLANVRFIQYDWQAGTASVIANYETVNGVAGIDFDPATSILVGVQTANSATGHQLNVYDASVSGTLPSIGTVVFPPPGTANPNLVGGVDITSNRIYAVATHNGVVALQVIRANTPVAPVIVSPPASQTVVQGGYTTLSAAVTGTQPITLQWWFNGVGIIGATNSTLRLTNITFEAAGDYYLEATNAAGTTISTNATLTVTPATLSSVLTPLWKKSPGELPFLASTDNSHRGIAYNPFTRHLLVVSRTGSNAVHILNPDTGEHLGSLNMGTGLIAGGALPINLVTVTPDGIIYAGNVTLDATTTEFRLYRWIDEDPVTEPVLVWHGDPGNGTAYRWGDTMSARLNTNGQPEILLGSRAGTTVAVIQPDVSGGGGNPPAILFNVPGATAGNFGLGIAWGGGDTFWGKAASQPLQHVALTIDPNAPTASILQTDTNFPSVAAIGVDPVANLLAGVAVERPDNVRLFGISNPTNLVYLDTEFFPTDNDNLNGTGAIAFAPNRLFALDSNNGIMAFTISSAAPRLNHARSGNQLTLTWSGSFTLQSRADLTTSTWQDVPGASSGYQVNLTADSQRFFRLRN